MLLAGGGEPVESQARQLLVGESPLVFCIVYVHANSVGCKYRETKIPVLEVY